MSRNENGTSKNAYEKLYKVDDVKNLDVHTVAELYKKYINSAQANIYSKLSFVWPTPLYQRRRNVYADG